MSVFSIFSLTNDRRMNDHIKTETPEPIMKNSQTYWPPVSDRTRSKTNQISEQYSINQKDIFNLGKLLEKKSVFSLEPTKYK